MQAVPEKTADIHPRPVMIETRRGAVECAVSGEGPAVLLIHGAMGGYDQGLLLARAAVGCSGFRFVAVSRPGYLATPLALGKTPEEQADLCAGVLDALDIRQAAVIAIEGGQHVSLFTHLHEIRMRVTQFLNTHAPLAAKPTG